jgi:hypothetical protein
VLAWGTWWDAWPPARECVLLAIAANGQPLWYTLHCYTIASPHQQHVDVSKHRSSNNSTAAYNSQRHHAVVANFSQGKPQRGHEPPMVAPATAAHLGCDGLRTGAKQDQRGRQLQENGQRAACAPRQGYLGVCSLLGGGCGSCGLWSG